MMKFFWVFSEEKNGDLKIKTSVLGNMVVGMIA